MGSATSLYKLSDYLKWAPSGVMRLPGYQPGRKCEEERLRHLMATILDGHPLGVMMLAETRKSRIWLKPRAMVGVPSDTDGEAALSAYLPMIERNANIDRGQLGRLLRTHLVEFEALQADDIDVHRAWSRGALVQFVEKALGRSVQRDIRPGVSRKSLDSFDNGSNTITDPED